MKLYIPEISDELRLTADWTFGLYNEDRNSTVMEIVSDTRKISYSFRDISEYFSIPCTIPAGEILKVDRIYIRKGKGEYSSVSFLWKGKRTKPRIEDREVTSWEEDPTLPGHRSLWPIGPLPWPGSAPAVLQQRVKKTYIVQDKYPARPARFWAKLEDVNNIEFEKV
jgi:hypothetical protein